MFGPRDRDRGKTRPLASSWGEADLVAWLVFAAIFIAGMMHWLRS